MPTGASIQAKITSTLRKLNASGRPVYWRTTTRVGGNATLGIGGTVQNVDVLADPQPFVDLIPTEMIASSGGKLQLGDYKILFDGSVPEADFKTKTLLYGSAVLKIIRVDPQAVYGTVVAWDVLAREVA